MLLQSNMLTRRAAAAASMTLEGHNRSVRPDGIELCELEIVRFFKPDAEPVVLISVSLNKKGFSVGRDDADFAIDLIFHDFDIDLAEDLLGSAQAQLPRALS